MEFVVKAGLVGFLIEVDEGVGRREGRKRFKEEDEGRQKREQKKQTRPAAVAPRSGTREREGDPPCSYQAAHTHACAQFDCDKPPP